MRTDIFGLAPRQGDMFGAVQETFDVPMTILEIRTELRATLDQLRAADTVPWPTRMMLRIETMFPDIAAKLPAEEAEMLVQEFTRQIMRLRSKAA